MSQCCSEYSFTFSLYYSYIDYLCTHSILFLICTITHDLSVFLSERRSWRLLWWRWLSRIIVGSWVLRYIKNTLRLRFFLTFSVLSISRCWLKIYVLIFNLFWCQLSLVNIAINFHLFMDRLQHLKWSGINHFPA